MLYMFINSAINPVTSKAILENIPKTLSFINGRKGITTTVDTIRSQLIDLTKNVQNPKKRYVRGIGPSINVNSIVLFYTSYVSDYDKDLQYNEFSKVVSQIRIIIVTTALSIGINIVDIMFVFQQKFNITRDIEDILQRLGRGGRILLLGVKSKAFLYLLYYIDDRLKTTLEGGQVIVPRTVLSTIGPLQQRS